MSSRLTPKEIEELVNKIRNRYEEGYKRFKGKGFNRKAFDERYLKALRERVDLQLFLYAEVQALEELWKKAEKAEEEEYIRFEKPFTKKIEAMLKEMNNRIQQYPPLDENLDLPEDINRFCGGLKIFLNKEWYPLRKMISSDNLKALKLYSKLTEKILMFCDSAEKSQPFIIDRFFIDEERSNEDNARINLFREAAALLKEIISFLNEFFEEENSAKVFIKDLVENFRLKDFI